MSLSWNGGTWTGLGHDPPTPATASEHAADRLAVDVGGHMKNQQPAASFLLGLLIILGMSAINIFFIFAYMFNSGDLRGAAFTAGVSGAITGLFALGLTKSFADSMILFPFVNGIIGMLFMFTMGMIAVNSGVVFLPTGLQSLIILCVVFVPRAIRRRSKR
jgi:hypothetical protein